MSNSLKGRLEFQEIEILVYFYNLDLENFKYYGLDLKSRLKNLKSYFSANNDKSAL